MTGPRVCTCGAAVVPVGAAQVERADGVHRPDPEDCEPIPAPAAALEHVQAFGLVVLVAFVAMAAGCFIAMFLADLVR